MDISFQSFGIATGINKRSTVKPNNTCVYPLHREPVYV